MIYTALTKKAMKIAFAGKRGEAMRVIADRAGFPAQLAREMKKGDFEDEERRIRLG